jgi:hypothetical protein
MVRRGGLRRQDNAVVRVGRQRQRRRVAPSSDSAAAALSDEGADTDELVSDLSGHPFLLVDAAQTSRAERERWCESLFETYGAPGVFVGKSGVTGLYANARVTGLTVDVGASGTSILPVQDGYGLLMGARRHAFGGQALATALLAADSMDAVRGPGAAEGAGAVSVEAMLARFAYLLPAAGLRRAAGAGAGHPSQALYRLSEAARRLREATASIAERSGEEEEDEDGGEAADDPMTGGEGSGSSGKPRIRVRGMLSESLARHPETFTLPDGSAVEVSPPALAVPEALYSGLLPRLFPLLPPQLPAAFFAPDVVAMSAHAPYSAAALPPAAAGESLPLCVLKSLVDVDAEARREVAANVVLTGGASALRGLSTRLVSDLHSQLDPALLGGVRPRLTCAAPEERAVGPWLGGSILGSLGTFPDLWFSKQEYEEHGAKMLHRKCP